MKRPLKPLRTSFVGEEFHVQTRIVAAMGDTLLENGLNNMECMFTAMMLAAELHKMSVLTNERAAERDFLEFCKQAYRQTRGIFQLEGDD